MTPRYILIFMLKETKTVFGFIYSYKSTEPRSLTGISNSRIHNKVIAGNHEDALLQIYKKIKSLKNINPSINEEPVSLEIKMLTAGEPNDNT